MKLLLVHNRIKKPNWKKGLDWFKQTPLELEIEYLETDLDLTFEQASNPGAKGWVLDETIKEKLRTIIPLGKCDVVAFTYSNKAPGVRLSQADLIPLYPETDFIEVARNTDNGLTFNHEFIHSLFHKLHRKGIVVEDSMDFVVVNGKGVWYYKNTSLTANPSNRTIALERLAPYWNLLTNTNNMYKPKNFALKELVSKATLDKYGEQAWQFLDERMLRNLQYIRETLGKPITVNTFLLQQRCFDPGEERGPYSQHAHGGAVDFSVQGMTAHQVREWLKTATLPEPNIWVEEDVGWCHLDVRYSEFKGVHFFKP